MKCNILNSDLILYAEGTLPPERRAHVESHIANCSECSEFHAFLVGSFTVVEKDKEVVTNPFFYTRVMARLDTDKNRGGFRLKRVMPAFVLSTLLIAGILAGINIGKLYSVDNLLYTSDLQEEISYLDDIQQESIESFFLTLNEDENE